MYDISSVVQREHQALFTHLEILKKLYKTKNHTQTVQPAIIFNAK